MNNLIWFAILIVYEKQLNTGVSAIQKIQLISASYAPLMCWFKDFELGIRNKGTYWKQVQLNEFVIIKSGMDYCETVSCSHDVKNIQLNLLFRSKFIFQI